MLALKLELTIPVFLLQVLLLEDWELCPSIFRNMLEMERQNCQTHSNTLYPEYFQEIPQKMLQHQPVHDKNNF